MSARDILARLRHGEALDVEALTWMARALADGRVSDAQAGAFAMGICLNGLDQQGRVALTLAMRDSGQVLDWDLNGPVLDKHSTGGVGDCVSLILAPALAACGAYVPMISGRGLGHTGGTLDKLEAIPGVSTQLEEAQFRAVVRDVGCAIVSASGDIAPADRRLYAVRDVTSTVDSLDLITASILSKKLAAGLDGLVLDVKVGSGAFMKELWQARALAEALSGTATAAGCPTTAVISDMNQPLVPSLGNALEVAEVMRVLSGAATGPILDVTAELGGGLLANGGLAASAEAGADALRTAVADGRALDHFTRMLSAMGAPADFAENWARILPKAPVIRAVPAPRGGTVSAIDGAALGMAVVNLGGGRVIEADQIDPAVGLSEVLRLGDEVRVGQPMALIHAAGPEAADAAEAAVLAAMTLGDTPIKAPELILERIG
ncbi:thymidine phosphorylase [Sulfitobacter sp. NFXS29]|uniref:thymidine phosphorylase n=1 Tax=Sulfitobacter sp. NFXS29 TaxID=2818438 RepID=UPI0032DEB48A